MSSLWPFAPFRKEMYILYHCMLEICNLLFDFRRSYCLESALSLKRDIGLLSSIETMKDNWDFWSWMNCIMHYDTAMSLWGQGNRAQRLRHLNTWSSVGGTAWVKLWGFAALLEEVCHCEETLSLQSLILVLGHSLLCLCGWRYGLSAFCSGCLLPCCPHYYVLSSSRTVYQHELSSPISLARGILSQQ